MHRSGKFSIALALTYTCAIYYKAFNARLGHVLTKYANCGSRKWKLTDSVKTYLLQRLLQLRKSVVCVTATTLQRDLAKRKKVKVSCSAIRKVLNKAARRENMYM